MTAAAPPAPVDLRAVRVAAGLSPAQVAARLGVHPTTPLRWERRERLPGPAHVRALAELYGADVRAVAAYFDPVRATPLRATGHVGRGLRPLRQQQGVGAGELATRLGVPISRVYNWEAGRARVPERHLPRLEAALGLAPGTAVALLRHPPVRVAPVPPPSSALRRLRTGRGLSQVELARAAGVGLTGLKAWERGQPPPLTALRGLAGALGLPADRLATLLGARLPRELDPRRWRPDDLPEVLRVLRCWSRLTQAGLARMVGCSEVTVRAWESGRLLPGAGARERLEILYRLGAGALLTAYPRQERSA